MDISPKPPTTGNIRAAATTLASRQHPASLMMRDDGRGALGHGYYSSDRRGPSHAGLIGRKFPKTVSRPATTGEAISAAAPQVKQLLRMAKVCFRLWVGGSLDARPKKSVIGLLRKSHLTT